MRAPKYVWKSYFDLPDPNRPLVFDCGRGVQQGTFWNGRFYSGHDSRGIDRILVGRWRYDEEPMAIKAVA